jgi:hypothetical protein
MQCITGVFFGAPSGQRRGHGGVFLGVVLAGGRKETGVPGDDAALNGPALQLGDPTSTRACPDPASTCTGRSDFGRACAIVDGEFRKPPKGAEATPSDLHHGLLRTAGSCGKQIDN